MKTSDVGIGVGVLVTMFGALFLAAGFGCCAWLVHLDMQEVKQSRSKRYTVHAASGEYQDLQRITTRTHWAKYKRPTGETIIFNGDFTEIEQ